MEVKYTISKDEKEDLWIVWRETHIGNGFGCKGLYRDKSKKACYEVKKELEAAEKDFKEVIKKYNRNGER